MLGLLRILRFAARSVIAPYRGTARWGHHALPVAVLAMVALPLCADVVHVYTQRVAGGVTNALDDVTQATGGDYVTAPAPKVTGYIFTNWTTTDANGFMPRDVFGRAHDAAQYHLYQSITLTANYLPASQDSDGDGVADGHEIYWYGSLAKSALSDSDGDGYTFAEELAAGTNPLMKDRAINGGVVRLDSDEWIYNPHGYPTVTIRSEPEGLLFETSVEFQVPGETVTGSTASRISSQFAYWTMNGVRVQDAFGRAVDTVQFAMPGSDVTLVAVCAADETARQKLYWYGTTDVSLDSDTDGDGCTFAQELSAGTNPLMKDRSIVGEVVHLDSDEWLYNPNRYCEYVIRSEPEGALFATQSDVVAPGTTIATPAVAKSAGFAYWTLNGVRQGDAFGRAVDRIEFAAPSERVELVAYVVADATAREQTYWYGDTGISLDSDTDGDGWTFAEELAAGTNPLMKDRAINGGVVWLDSDEAEMNLQPYEQVQGAVVGGAYSQMFTSPVAGNAATSATFGNGGAVWPVVADVNDDGLWDLIVVSETETNVFVNVGSKGNPEFEVDENGALGDRALPYVDTNNVAKLEGFSLDVAAPEDALSATMGDANQDGIADLLVSDSEGRIWYFKGNGDGFTLQHKVWGGSFAGFAEGLRLAAVDWEDDGDLDCLAGTADGKLMLLRDPRVGRPTNVKALAGVDNILLTWDPNQQSRIRGYRLYRAPADVDEFARIAQPQLPTYRDFPDESGEFDYKVSSVSRFYTEGNSTPTETESMPTEAVRAELGKVKFFWNDVAVKLGEQAAVMLSIENSMNYNVAGKSQTVAYDPAYLTPVKVVKSGITEDISFTESVDSAQGEWTISITGAVGGGTPTLPAGGGKFLTLVFDTLKDGTTKVGGETGATVSVSIAPRSEIAPYRLGDVDGDGDVGVEDLRLLAKLKNGNGRKPTENQIMAGDFNGNGKLDNADYQALRALLKEKGAL